MNRLKGKVAIVTGAAKGIGLVISQAFVREGASVVMCDIDVDKCNEEASKLTAGGGVASSIKCDVGVTKDIQRVVENTIADFGKVDVLVNNAAIAVAENIMDLSEPDWDHLMNINLKSVFRGIKFVLPHMIEHQSGSVISLSSVQAFRSWDNWTAYAAAKGAIVAMSNQLAGQFGRENIRFNTISPGAILTPLNERRIEQEGGQFLESSIRQSALLRMGDSGEVAMTAVFLASDEARFITGEDIKIDGGLTSLPRYLDNDNKENDINN